jgi:AbrB family looped-hinge helix DNA binding protein
MFLTAVILQGVAAAVRMEMHRFKLKVTSKGQVTLPAAFRRLAEVDEGDTLDLLVDENGRATLKKRRSIDELVGSLRHLNDRLGRPLEKADIKSAVDEAMAEQEERSRSAKRR